MKRDIFLVVMIKFALFIILLPCFMVIFFLSFFSRTIEDFFVWLEEKSFEMLVKIVDLVEKLNPPEVNNDN